MRHRGPGGRPRDPSRALPCPALPPPRVAARSSSSSEGEESRGGVRRRRRGEMEAEKKPPAVSDVGAWAMNVVSSVGIIMANKQLMSSSGYAFSFGTLRAFARSSSSPFPSPQIWIRRFGFVPGDAAAGSDFFFFFSFPPLVECSHDADRIPLHGHGARRMDLQRHRLLRIQARPALGARLVLPRRQHVHHRDEP